MVPPLAAHLKKRRKRRGGVSVRKKKAKVKLAPTEVRGTLEEKYQGRQNRWTDKTIAQRAFKEVGRSTLRPTHAVQADLARCALALVVRAVVRARAPCLHCATPFSHLRIHAHTGTTRSSPTCKCRWTWTCSTNMRQRQGTSMQAMRGLCATKQSRSCERQVPHDNIFKTFVRKGKRARVRSFAHGPSCFASTCTRKPLASRAPPRSALGATRTSR